MPKSAMALRDRAVPENWNAFDTGTGHVSHVARRLGMMCDAAALIIEGLNLKTFRHEVMGGE
jgi:hypothetical protein